MGEIIAQAEIRVGIFREGMGVRELSQSEKNEPPKTGTLRRVRARVFLFSADERITMVSRMEGMAPAAPEGSILNWWRRAATCQNAKMPVFG